MNQQITHISIGGFCRKNTANSHIVVTPGNQRSFLSRFIKMIVPLILITSCVVCKADVTFTLTEPVAMQTDTNVTVTQFNATNFHDQRARLIGKWTALPRHQ